MIGRRALLTTALVLLGLLTIGLGSRVAARLSTSRIELSRVKLTTLSDELSAKLGTLRDDVFVTYYVTGPARMPSHLKHVEREVVALLDALKDASKGRLKWALVDPSADPDLERFAARRKVAPVRVRSVAHDRWSEQEVWSTLSLGYGPRTPALIEGIGKEHLSRLQAIVLEHLNQLESPRKPVFALAAPREGHSLLRADLARRGDLREVDLEHTLEIGRDVDVLFVVDPPRGDATTLRKLRHYQEGGGALVVIGSLHRAEIDASMSTLTATPAGDAFDAILREFGIRAVPGVLLDRKSAAQNLPNGDPGSIFRVGCLTLNQDFESLARDPRGTILFPAPNPLQLDSERLADLGLVAEVLATSSDESALLPLPGSARIDAATAATAGDAVPKQPLLVIARPHERWKGAVVAASASSFAHDRFYGVDTLANARTVETLIETLASGDRLVMRRAGVVKPPPLPELEPAARSLWRFVVVLLIPALLLGWLALRALRDPSRRVASDSSRAGRLATRVALGVVSIGFVAGATRTVLPSIDATRDRVHALAEHSSRIAASIDREVKAKLWFSDSQRLPPELRDARRSLDDTLRKFRGAGAAIVVESRDPETLGVEAKAELSERGLKSFRATSLLEEVTTVREYFAALELEGYDRRMVLGFPDLESFENVEFRIALALRTIESGDRARVGFASDVPRLSAGEAWQFYQQRGLIPPSGKDVYSLARALLENNGFEVTHVNPRAPEIPPGIDALIWLQPRRSTVPMLEKFVDFVYRGGRALLLAQHFSMQARQYRGRDLDFVYWPQPQTPDVEEFYWPDLGIEMVRKVLFDHNSFPIRLETQLHRSGRREFHVQDLAKPFCVRASAHRFDPESWITRTLSDMPFLYPAYFAIDRSKLAATDLRVTPLIATSERTWSFDWKGGWIPPGMMSGPGATPREDLGHGDVDAVPEDYLGSVPLALDVRGRFPWPKEAFEFPPVTVGADGVPIETEPRKAYPHPEPTSEAAEGRVILVAQSEMLKDEMLQQLRPSFRPDHLLLNAAAELSLGPEFASIMAHRPTKRGFERVPSESILAWRYIVVFAVPILFVLSAMLRRVVEPIRARRRVAALGVAS